MPPPFIFIRFSGLLLAALLPGCAPGFADNPSFPLDVVTARQSLRLMQNDPKPLARPVIVLAGFADPGIISETVVRDLRRVFANSKQIMDVSFLMCPDFDSCRDRVIMCVDESFPSHNPLLTTEVDVVAISMGGLVALHAARERDDGGRRLRIARLFTISTPHQGAALADWPTMDKKQLAMRRHSQFLHELNNDESSQQIEIVPYSRLGDMIVGIENTAPPGRNPWWMPNEPLEPAHVFAPGDPRILADICRRLRGESPFTRTPAAPLPVETTATPS